MSMLGNKDSRDPELLFRGEGRGAFIWLQCFIATEEDWCCGKGCPGQTLDQALLTMPLTFLRLHCQLRPPGRAYGSPCSYSLPPR